MQDFISKISVLKDALAATGETLREFELILITLGALSDDYESLVTSITTQLDKKMTFSALCELLMDYEIRMERKMSSKKPLSSIAVPSLNVVVKHESGHTKAGLSELKCQICSRKGHSTPNCYNHINLQRFPPTHGRELSVHDPTGGNRSTTSAKSVNMIVGSSDCRTLNV